MQSFEKISHFIISEDVIDREHRNEVGALLEGVEWGSADSLGRGIGIVKIRVCFFEILKLAKKAVVFSVRNFGLSVLIVELVVVGEDLAEFRDTVVKKHVGILIRDEGEREAFESRTS